MIPAGTGMSRYKDIDIDVEVLDHKPEALVAMENKARAEQEEAGEMQEYVDGDVSMEAPAEFTEEEQDLKAEEAGDYLQDDVNPDDEA